MFLVSVWPAGAGLAAAGIAGDVKNKTLLSTVPGEYLSSWACSLCRAAVTSPVSARFPWFEGVAISKFLISLEGFGKVCQ